MRLGSQISHVDPEWCLGATLTTVVYLWLTTLSSAVQESGLVFPGQLARLTHRVQHSEFFFCYEVLPRCDRRCTIEEIFLLKIKKSLDAVNSDIIIADIALVFGCITITVSY